MEQGVRGHSQSLLDHGIMTGVGSFSLLSDECCLRFLILFCFWYPTKAKIRWVSIFRTQIYMSIALRDIFG